MPAIKLNDKYLRNLKPKAKRFAIYDEIVTGLGVRIMPSGIKTFYISYYSLEKGYNKRFTLGKFPALGIADARKLAAEIISKAKQGIDPNAEKKKREQEQEQAMTFNRLADCFVRDYLCTLRPSTQKVYNSLIKNHIRKTLGKKEIKQFTRQDARRFLRPYADAGQPVHCNRIHATLSKMLNFAVDEGYLKENPILGLNKLGVEKNKKRVYNDDEIKALWDAIESESDVLSVFLKMLLLLGQRRGETAIMQWEHIDFKKGVWTIPEENAKNGNEHELPLSRYAIELLDTLKPITGQQSFVFNSLRKDNAPINSFSKLSNRLQKRTGIADFTLHNIRRTVATRIEGDGTPYIVIQKVLNHVNSTVTGTYTQADYSAQKRTALLNWQRNLTAVVTGDETQGKVTTLKSG